MDLLGRRQTDRVALARVRGWARELLALGPDDTVTATELTCAEPGCPPHETVLLIARTGEPTVQLKLDKRASGVQRLDLEQAIDLQGAPFA